MQPSVQYVLTGESLLGADPGAVGHKAAGVARLARLGLAVPESAALSIDAFRAFVEQNGIAPAIEALGRVNGGAPETSAALGAEIADAIRRSTLPDGVLSELRAAALRFETRWANGTPRFAVRSSGSHEDLDGRSFAGIYDTYLNVSESALAARVIDTYASLFSPRALAYAARLGLAATRLGMGVLVQAFVPARVAGTVFSIDPETTCPGILRIEAVRGLGEGLVSGRVSPDAWTVNKRNGRVIGRSLGGSDSVTPVSAGEGVETLRGRGRRRTFCLDERQVAELAEQAVVLEAQQGLPLDIEWARTSRGETVFLQMRPLRIPEQAGFVHYEIHGTEENARLVVGTPITSKAVSGRVRLAEADPGPIPRGAILVVRHLEPEWLPFLGDAAAVVVEGGGHTSHMSIILREHGIPAVYGASGAFSALTDGQLVTVVCVSGEAAVWNGALRIEERAIDPAGVRKPRHAVHVVTSTTADLDRHLKLPLEGIGLVRSEFLIWKYIGVHPQALLDHDAGKLPSGALRSRIRERIRGFPSARAWYVEKLAEVLCAFAARCPGKIVNVRLPDFTSDDYLGLLGGERYEEAADANPMLGWRGTTRLISDQQRAALAMDCEALRRAVDDLGFDNIRVLVPFCRTPEDGAVIAASVRRDGPRDVPVGMMVEIPSNVMLAHEFAETFDFFLIGPMDLTQLTYGADRTSARLSKYSSEVAAVKEMVKHFLTRLRGFKKDVFIGGWPLFQFLPEYEEVRGHNRLLLVELPDRLLELFENLNQLEARLEERLTAT